MHKTSFVVVFISNGPGELSTWVRPIAEKLHASISMQPRDQHANLSLRLVLVPCPNSTGNERSAALKWGLFESISPAHNFWKLLLNPRQYNFWPSKGLVIFLGGDQFWSILFASRLGYKNITYAEWIARWPRWNDGIAAMSETVKNKLPKTFRKKCKIVGDLMADLPDLAKVNRPLPEGEWIALMPGSKKAKLCVGVPFFLEVADLIAKIKPKCNFLLPIASTTNIKEIKNFVSTKNPIAKNYKSSIANVYERRKNERFSKIITNQGTEIYIQENQPCYEELSQCNLALTTVGANTAELGAIGVPMIVIIPTQHLAVMQAWDGFVGLLARLPGLNWCLGLLLSAWKLRNHGFLSWPNISAGKLIVPERIGIIYPNEIADEAIQWISSPSRLMGQKEDLRSLRGTPGAINRMAEQIIDFISDEIKITKKFKKISNSKKEKYL